MPGGLAPASNPPSPPWGILRSVGGELWKNQTRPTSTWVLVVACKIFLVVACGIHFPDQRSNPGPLHWEPRVLANGPPGKSLHSLLTQFFHKTLNEGPEMEELSKVPRVPCSRPRKEIHVQKLQSIDGWMWLWVCEHGF